MRKNANIRNHYNQIPHLTQDTTWESEEAQWLSGRVLDLRPKGRGFEPHRRHCVVSLSKNINPSLVLFQPGKTCPFITERLLMGCKESNETNKIWERDKNTIKHHTQKSQMISPFPAYVVGTERNSLNEMGLLSTQNICSN